MVRRSMDTIRLGTGPINVNTDVPTKAKMITTTKLINRILSNAADGYLDHPESLYVIFAWDAGTILELWSYRVEVFDGIDMANRICLLLNFEIPSLEIDRERTRCSSKFAEYDNKGLEAKDITTPCREVIHIVLCGLLESDHRNKEPEVLKRNIVLRYHDDDARMDKQSWAYVHKKADDHLSRIDHRVSYHIDN
jgi:hypothetical protein